MRIAVTSMGETMESPVDPRFGRARYFIVYDLDGEGWEVVDNGSAIDAAQGAGVQAAQRVAQAGVGAVATGHCGPKAFRALEAAGVEVVVGAEGTVREVVERYRRGELARAGGADVGAHAGGTRGSAGKEA